MNKNNVSVRELEEKNIVHLANYCLMPLKIIVRYGCQPCKMPLRDEYCSDAGPAIPACQDSGSL